MSYSVEAARSSEQYLKRFLFIYYNLVKFVFAINDLDLEVKYSVDSIDRIVVNVTDCHLRFSHKLNMDVCLDLDVPMHDT